jgi:chromosome segregation ATPase
MWPKAIAQLVELAPHVGRLVPLADRFFQNKSSAEDDNRKLLQSISEGLRTDLGQVTASHAGIYRQLNDQNQRLSVVAAEIEGARSAVEAVGARITKLEQRMSGNTTMLAITVLLNVVLLGFVAGLLLRH